MTGILAVATPLLLAATQPTDRRGPTAVFVLTILIVVSIFGTVVRRTLRGQRDQPVTPPPAAPTPEPPEGSAPAEDDPPEHESSTISNQRGDTP